MGGEGSGNPNIRDIVFKKKENCTPEQWDKQKEYWNRQKGVPKKRKWTKEVCIFQLEEIMDLLKKKIEDDDFKQLEIIVNKMMDIIKYLYPPIQQSVNLNIDTTSDAVIDRLKNWKKKQLVIIDDEN